MQSYKKMEYDKPFFEKVFSTQRMEKYFKLGFWVSLLNSEYERLLWKDLRRAFPFMPKKDRQRKNVSAPLNTISEPSVIAYFTMNPFAGIWTGWRKSIGK